MKSRCEQQSFVLKEIPEDIDSNFHDRVWPRLRQNPSALLRLPLDAIPGRHVFVYRYVKRDLLRLVREKVSMRARRRILTATLRAIADLHDRDIVHLGTHRGAPPHRGLAAEHAHRYQARQCHDRLRRRARNNHGTRSKADRSRERSALTSREMHQGHARGERRLAKSRGAFRRRAQQTDRSVLVRPGRTRRHSRTSRTSFREAHRSQCLSATLGRVLCGPDEDFHKHESQGAIPALIRLQRLVSYFGHRDGLNGLLTHLGDREANCHVVSMLESERAESYISYTPSSEWPATKDDEALQDLIKGLMSLDPGRRLTAAEALQHPWCATES